MAFPLTHLLVAKRIITLIPMSDLAASQFILGSIAPDGVHHRKAFTGENALMSHIGPAKKITHLCPISDEKWGQVTDNDGWIKLVQAFHAKYKDDPLYVGYAVHVLTDIYNNLTVWANYIANYPDEAAKGYKSVYYEDLRNIDNRLYHELAKDSGIFEYLRKGVPKEIYDTASIEIASAEEILTIQKNLLCEQYKNPMPVDITEYHILHYTDILKSIDDAAQFCIEYLGLN